MKALSIFPFYVVNFGITLAGYGIVSFLVTDIDLSQLVTIPYRLSVLSLNLILILFNLGIIYSARRSLAINSIKDLLGKQSIIALIIFVVAYSFKMIYEIFANPNVSLYLEPSQYLIFWFSITLIPAINFLFIDHFKPESYLLITWLMHLGVGLLAIFANPSQDASFFNDQGRLAVAALNPISMGQYGGSLFLLSIYIWLRARTFSFILLSKWRFLYLTSAIIGLIVNLLAGSRGPITALIVSLLFIFATSKKVNLKTLYSIIFIAVVLYGTTFLALDKGGSFLERFLLVGDEFDIQGQSRGFLLQTAFSLVAENPLTGVGLEIPGVGYPHNLIAESFLPLGIISGLLFLGLYINGVLKSIKLLTDSTGEWGWLGILFIQYAVISLSSGSLYASSLFWYLLFALIGINTRLASQVIRQREIDLAGSKDVNC
jgi:hypothetical protein